MTGDAPVIQLEGIHLRYDAVRALDGADLSICRGERIGLIGHNGAGKSTLMNVLAGVAKPDAGDLRVGGRAAEGYSPARALQLGVRCVFQELSLCPNLTVAENTRMAHPALKGFGWRGRAAELIRQSLDAVFPGHGVSPSDRVSDLNIGQRQMVEVARALTVTTEPVRLVILDEPTSSLDARCSQQLLSHVERLAGEGVAFIVVSHMLAEVLDHTDRIVVMRDGKVAASGGSGSFTRELLIQAMGGATGQDRLTSRSGVAALGEVWVQTPSPAKSVVPTFTARQGEIIGLAGLAGHGQTRFLQQIYRSRLRAGGAGRNRRAAFVVGDRQSEGVFPRWSIADNITVRSLADLRSGLLISPKREQAMAEAWGERLKIRAASLGDGILSLSGGNQQKALFARALGSQADIILMDDPMRGVDISTKLEVYRLIHAEASGGRCFLWYTTEAEELGYCDRVYVFRDGVIVAEVAGPDVSQELIVQMSFQEAGHA